MSSRALPFVAIFAVSFALLVDEIMLSAIFHVLLGAGSTVAAIAIALVGFSASGVVAFATPTLRDPERAADLTPKLLFVFGVALMSSSFLVMAVPISHGDLVYSKGEVATQLWKLAVYHIAGIPFFLGGLAIAILLRAHAAVVGRLYAWDLAGAAIGCLLSPLILSALGAPRAILFAALPAALIGAWLTRRGGRRVALLALPLALLVLDVAAPRLRTFATLNTMGEVRDPAYRSFPIGPADLEFERWALDAWTILRDPGIPDQWEAFDGWGLSRSYEGAVPRTRFVNYNARFSTFVTEFDGDLERLAPWIDADLTALHHHLGREYPSVLNIGAGGGREVLAALLHGAEEVVAVDVSDVVIEELMKGKLREYSGGLYLDPRVTAVAAEGRTFSERTRRRFDLIEFSIVGGVNLEKMDLVRIDDLFTREALATYVSRLEETGVFSYVMYTTRADRVAEMAAEDFLVSHPYIPVLRALSGLRIAVEGRDPGVTFEDHVLVSALRGVIDPGYDLVHIVVSPTAFTALERNRFVSLSEELDFEVLVPARDSAVAPEANLYARIALAPDLKALSATLPFNVLPATDDRPFQYAFNAAHLGHAWEQGALFRVISGNPLVSLGLTIGLLALVVTLIPLVLTGEARAERLASLRRARGLLAYFACIGFGFMAIEIAALLRLQTYLGKPIYGLSVGLFAFLLAGSLGSRLTERFDSKVLVQRVTQAVLAVAVIGVVFYAGSDDLFAATIAESLAVRIPLAVASIFPLACVMGMFFPMGIRLLEPRGADLVPWAWAINGCMSVIGIFGARITALFFGFGTAFLVGVATYFLILVCVHSARRVEPA